MSKLVLLVGLLSAVVGTACKSPQPAQKPAVEQPATAAVADTTKAAAYPLDYCIVTGEKLGSMGEPIVYLHEGRTIKFCCTGCVETFKKDPTKWLAKIDEAVKVKAGK